MITCSTCGSYFIENEDYCPYCGRRNVNLKTIEYATVIPEKNNERMYEHQTIQVGSNKYIRGGNELQTGYSNTIEYEIHNRIRSVKIQSIICAAIFYLLFILNILIAFVDLPNSLITLIFSVPMFSAGIMSTIRAVNPETDKVVIIRKMELTFLLQMKYFADRM